MDEEPPQGFWVTENFYKSNKEWIKWKRRQEKKKKIAEAEAMGKWICKFCNGLSTIKEKETKSGVRDCECCGACNFL